MLFVTVQSKTPNAIEENLFYSIEKRMIKRETTSTSKNKDVLRETFQCKSLRNTFS